MYYDKQFFEWHRNEYLPQPPVAWTQLQAARKKQLLSRINSIEGLLEKTEVKLQQTKKRLRAVTKALADCQTQLIQRDRQLCVCKIKVLKVPAK
jgi:septal ring factor EnvC (AmiA/AmiB activator)